MKLIDTILYKEAKNSAGIIFLILFLMMLLVGFDAIAPWPFKILIDNVLSINPIEPDTPFYSFLAKFNSRELLGFFTVLVYFLSTFLLTITEYASSILTKFFVKKVTADFSKNAFKNLQTLKIGFYRQQQIGDFIYRLSYDVSAFGELFEEGLFPLLTSGLYLLITVSIMFWIDQRLTLISLAALPFLSIGLYFFNANLDFSVKKSEYFNSAIFSFIEEALTHLKIIQAFIQEKRESKTFDQKMETSLRSDLTVYRFDFLLSLIVGVVIAISYSIIITYGIRSVFAGTLTTGLLIVFIFYLDNLTNPILSLIYSAAAIKTAYVKIGRMRDFFEEKSHTIQQGKVKKLINTAIKFDNVSLKGKGGTSILSHISFEIPAHKRTVILGANGSGKSSIVSLIMRFIDEPSSGNIYIGGINIREYDVQKLRDQIAFVPQEITLFDDTIRHNITFGNPHASFQDVKKAAILAAADSFISTLPKKYDFRVGEAGNFLSGGQRQRLMLARALLKKDADILLFDETLSALDVKTRGEVINNLFLFSKAKTTIIVSNIFDVVSAADHVIVLNKGKLIYTGPSSHIAREAALYKILLQNN